VALIIMMELLDETTESIALTVYTRWKSNPFGELLVRWVELSYQSIYVRSYLGFPVLQQRPTATMLLLAIERSRSSHRPETILDRTSRRRHGMFKSVITLGIKVVAVWTF
jgi:hypothetical protein